MRPLSLTDAQYRLIHEAAKHVPVEWRHRMLQAVADRLLAIDVITDAHVGEAVHAVLYRLSSETVA